MTNSVPAASNDAITFIIDSWDGFPEKKLSVDEINSAFDYLSHAHTQVLAIMMLIAEVKKRTIDSEYASTLAIIEKSFVGGKEQ